MDSTDDIHAEKIRELSLWTGPIRLEPLDGGITNRNYLVHMRASAFGPEFARTC